MSPSSTNMDAPGPVRKLRADAARNRRKVLDAAAAALEEHGVGFSMEAVARKAGVGAGTLYRNFSTRDDLVAAVLEDQGMSAPNIDPRSIGSGLDAVTALDQWLAVLARWFTTYEGLTGSLQRAVDSPQSPLSMQCHEVIARLDELIDLARADGLIQPKVTGRDLYLAALGLAWAAQHGGESDHFLELFALGWKADPQEN
ncbi:TetR/AcrR family transcriptional regulator [Schaalia vaccimaxillae]|uniref:TetR/AcrR family transcriptional regulator n=1 Tax=Schaalia vaccimaxillae TaxID=183916 RepID=UPI00040C7B1A|nr:TetR/AcrR family transcriptional regulator [Schaalia vaccimaxillae]